MQMMSDLSPCGFPQQQRRGKAEQNQPARAPEQRAAGQQIMRGRRGPAKESAAQASFQHHITRFYSSLSASVTSSKAMECEAFAKPRLLGHI